MQGDLRFVWIVVVVVVVVVAVVVVVVLFVCFNNVQQAASGDALLEIRIKKGHHSRWRCVEPAIERLASIQFALRVVYFKPCHPKWSKLWDE